MAKQTMDHLVVVFRKDLKHIQDAVEKNGLVILHMRGKILKTDLGTKFRAMRIHHIGDVIVKEEKP